MAGDLVLLDAASLWFRAFHGQPTTVTAPDGSPVNAVRGMVDHLARVVRDHRPRGLVACLDADWRPAFRVALLPSYKAHRLAEAVADSAADDAADGAPGAARAAATPPVADPVQASIEASPPELAPQVAVLLELLPALGVPTVGVPGYEADDVIASYVAQRATPLLVVSGDRDLFALLRPGVDMLYTVDRTRYTARDVEQRYGVPSAAAYGDFALLRGDPSDGLPGVRGVGEKSAQALLAAHGSVAALLADLDRGGPRSAAAARVAADRDYVERAQQVVAAVVDLPLPAGEPTLGAGTDPATVTRLAERWGLQTCVQRFLAACAG